MSKFKTLLLAYHGGNNHAISLAVRQFSEQVTQRTNGQIAIATVQNSALGNIPQLLRLVSDGSADMALLPYERLGLYAPRFGCIGMPFVFDDHAHADRVLNAEFDAWARPSLATLGVTLLSGWEWGFRQLSNSRRAILRPEDLQDLKIRVPPVPPFRSMVVALGGIPVMVEFSQLLRAIRRGLIDGQENPVSVIHSLGLPFEQKYLSMLNYIYGQVGHVVNSDCFASLSVEQQIILYEESLKAGEFARQFARSHEAALLDEFTQQGMQIDHPDLAPFKALMPPVYAELGEIYGADNVRDFLAMVDRQRHTPEPSTR